jgi:hypothetical protein
MANLRSFAELGGDFTGEKSVETKKIFDRVLNGKFDQVSTGNFKSELPEIESITLLPFLNDKENPQIRAVIFYKDKNFLKKSITWSIFKDGIISGEMKDLPVSREDMSLEIMRLIEKLNIDFWRKIDLDILPGSDESDGGVDLPGVEGVSGPNFIDPERLAFLEKQPRVIFGFVNGLNGFKDYHAAVFPKFILLDHPVVGNAAYILDLQNPIQVDEGIFEKPSAQRVDDEFVAKAVEMYWKPIAEEAKTRGQLRQKFGARKIVHTQDTWQDRLQTAINERM